jgi:hypothetical protein
MPSHLSGHCGAVGAAANALDHDAEWAGAGPLGQTAVELCEPDFFRSSS